MRSLIVSAIVLIFGLSACDSSGVPEPEDIDTCEDLAAATADLLQAELDVLAGLELGPVLAVPGPPELEELEATGDALSARAAAIGCTPAELNQLLRDASEGLDADGPIAERFLEAIRNRLGIEP